MAKDLFPSPHPLTPPHHEEELVDWFRLLRSRRVGPTTFHRLMREHGSASAALAALPAIASDAGVKGYAVASAETAQAELHAGRLAGAVPVPIGSAGYPALLAMQSDAPPVLWALGKLAVLARPMVALVGARNASSLGARMARRLAEGLSDAGYIVVSGLARGIDTTAHMAACKGGTLAVMPGGVDVVYPADNAVLAQELCENGLRISEIRPGEHPRSRHFPQRNRIIAGLSQAVVVVEAAARSGSLITARCALDQGRDVLAVPGHPFDARAGGGNMLIRDGATLVRGPDDVLDMLRGGFSDAHNRTEQPQATATPAAAGLPQAELHAQILSQLGPSPVAEDQLIRDLHLPAASVAPELVTLELDGRIERQAGGLLCLPAGG